MSAAVLLFIVGQPKNGVNRTLFLKVHTERHCPDKHSDSVYVIFVAPGIDRIEQDIVLPGIN